MADSVCQQFSAPLSAAASPERPRASGEAAAAKRPPLLEPLGKSCDADGQVKEEVTWCIRAEDCRCEGKQNELQLSSKELATAKVR